MEGHEGAAPCPVFIRVCIEVGTVKHCEIRHKTLDLVTIPCHLNEHITGKKIVPGKLIYDAYRLSELLIRTGITILNEHGFPT